MITFNVTDGSVGDLSGCMWTLTGNTLVFTFINSGSNEEATLSGNTFTLSNGEDWVYQRT